MTVTSTEVADLDYIATMEMDGWAVRQMILHPNYQDLDAGEAIEFVVVFEKDVTNDRWRKQDRRNHSGAAFVSSKGASL